MWLRVETALACSSFLAAPLPMDLVIARELEIYGSHGMAASDYQPGADHRPDRSARNG